MKSIYIALTIGPIFKTIDQARHTRELWAASYLFSHLMKCIIKELKKDKQREFLIPYVGDENAFLSAEDKDLKEEKYKKGTGLFPDRCIFRTTNINDIEEVNKIVSKTLNDIADEVANSIGANPEKVATFFQSYFKIYILQKSLPDNVNPTKVLTPYLDVLELQQNYSLREAPFLATFMDRVPGTFLAKEAFGAKISFKTLADIATREFAFDQEATGEEDNLMNYLSNKYHIDKKQVSTFRQAHKYIAIVHADGDNVGKTIGELPVNKIQEYNGKLQKFALDAVEEISEYGGMPVFAGGDDLLFFAPVLNVDDHIFNLIERLDQLLQNQVEGSSLSFGVSISYYKFPLNEALEISRHLLFSKAKKVKGKNAIALKILKHSGQSFGGIFQIKDKERRGKNESEKNGNPEKKNSFDQFKSLLQQCIKNSEIQLSSVAYKIQRNAGVFIPIGKNEIAVSNFIDNSFNEGVHREESASTYLDSVKELIPIVFNDEPNAEKALDQVYGILRIISFLTATHIQ